MNFLHLAGISLVSIVYASKYECPSDIILQVAVNRRVKDLGRECSRVNEKVQCDQQKDADEAWEEFVNRERNYTKLVAECVAGRQRVRRQVQDDPNDPTIDHTGHNHRRRRQNDDPNDPTIDHTGHNHRRRRQHDDDPSDPTVDHTGHNHRRRRHNDNENKNRGAYAPPPPRIRRSTCDQNGAKEQKKIATSFEPHCTPSNICLPDEDLPAGPKRDAIKQAQELRAKAYSNYVNKASYCNAFLPDA